MPPRPSSQSEGLNSNAPRMSQSPLSTAQGIEIFILQIL